MNNLSELIAATEQTLAEAESKLKTLQEMQIPNTLQGKVASLVERYVVVRNEIYAWRVEFLRAVTELSKMMDLPDLVSTKFSWRSKYPNLIHEQGTACPGGDTIQDHVWKFATNPPLEFWNALLERIINFLKEQPQAQSQQIDQLLQLAQRINGVGKKKAKKKK